jgi:hypothetical protein
LEEGGIEAFIRREVLPYTPDAWLVEADTKIGYEVSFTRHFYQPPQLRTLAEISADILALEQETEGLLSEITRESKGNRLPCLVKPSPLNAVSPSTTVAASTVLSSTWMMCCLVAEGLAQTFGHGFRTMHQPTQRSTFSSIGTHRLGEWQCLEGLKKAAIEAGKKITFSCWAAIRFENRKKYKNSAEVLWPAVVPNDQALATYMALRRNFRSNPEPPVAPWKPMSSLVSQVDN